jgi:hypothetical protein
MKPAPVAPLRDPELLELLAGEPELLAFADAIVSTYPPPEVVPRRMGRLAAVAGAVAVLGVAVALALTLPSSQKASLVDRALAAVGEQPVLHVVIARPAGSPGSLVEIDTGRPIKRTERTEIWFDHGRDLKKMLTTLDGAVLDETLETDQGGFARGGPIITCAWIAAHPIEATKMRVSCNPNGDNGTVPRKVPEQPPTLEEALSGFVDGYRSALASGRAHEIGRGRLDGRDIVWLELPGTGGPESTEKVAVDAATYKPVYVEYGRGGASFRVLAAETVAFDPALFARPKQVVGQAGGSTTSSTDVNPRQAAAALGGTAVWLGPSWRNYRLLETKRDELAIGYGRLSERRPTHATGIEFVYGRVRADGTVDKDSTFSIAETTTCTVVWGWTCSARDPIEPGTMLTLLPRNLLRDHGLYVTIWDWQLGAQPPPLEIARALRPLGTFGALTLEPTVKRCPPAAQVQLVRSLVAAFNAGDYRALGRLVAPEPAFQWFSAIGPDGRIGKEAENRATLAAYIRKRHRHHDHLSLVGFGAVDAQGRLDLTLRIRRRADDYRPRNLIPAKQDESCSGPRPLLIVWSM